MSTLNQIDGYIQVQRAREDQQRQLEWQTWRTTGGPYEHLGPYFTSPVLIPGVMPGAVHAAYLLLTLVTCGIAALVYVPHWLILWFHRRHVLGRRRQLHTDWCNRQAMATGVDPRTGHVLSPPPRPNQRPNHYGP